MPKFSVNCIFNKIMHKPNKYFRLLYTSVILSRFFGNANTMNYFSELYGFREKDATSLDINNKYFKHNKKAGT